MRVGSFLILVLITVGCSNNEHLTERLEELQPIQFSGKSIATVTTHKPSSKKLRASCDRTTTGVLISVTGEEPWVKIEDYPGVELESMVKQCQSRGEFQVDVLKSKLIPWFKWGEKGQKKVYFRAVSGDEMASISELKVSYKPGSIPRASTRMMVYPSAGKVTNINGVSIRYKMGHPNQGLVRGSVYQIKKRGL